MNDYDTEGLIWTKVAQNLEGTSEERAEIIEATRAYIKDRIREESWTRKILPPQAVMESELEVDEKEDSFYKLVPIEPDSWALPVNFTGAPPTQYTKGKRYKVPFYVIETPLYMKTAEELLATMMPFVKVIEQNSVIDIQEKEDSRFKVFMDLAIKLRGGESGGAEVKSTQKKFEPELLTQGLQTISNQKGMLCETILMTDSTKSEIASWGSSQFDVGAKEITIEGYKYEVLNGKKLIVSVKTNILPVNEVYFFAGPQYLGNFFIVGDTQFFIEKKGRMYSWCTWENIGMGIGNIKGIGKVSYKQPVTPGDTGTGDSGVV